MKLSADQFRPFGKTPLRVPPLIFGSSALGDRRRVIPDPTKRKICVEWFRHVDPPVVIDMAVEYGAGLALETLRTTFARLEIGPDEVIISARLTLQRFDYDGTLECWEEVCRLLGGYQPRLVSIDGLDPYLSAADTPAERKRRFHDILDAYRALGDLKSAGRVIGVGGATSDWRMTQEIGAAVPLDWVMLSEGLTILRHPPEVLQFVTHLADRQIAVINSGLFHGGFLTGGKSLDCRVLRPENDADRSLFAWRKSFVALCEGHGITPAHACIQFGLSAPSVVAVLVGTSHPDRVAANVESVVRKVPSAFWASMKEEGLLAEDYPYIA